MIVCECGLYGSKTREEAREFIDSKKVMTRKNFWTYTKCTQSDLLHCFDGDRFTEEEYLRDIKSGAHMARINKRKEQAEPMQTYSSPPVSSRMVLALDNTETGTCNKIAYGRREYAEMAQDDTMQAYSCKCGAWHLATKQEHRPVNPHNCKRELVMRTNQPGGHSQTVELLMHPEESDKPIYVAISCDGQVVNMRIDAASQIVKLLGSVLSEEKESDKEEI